DGAIFRTRVMTLDQMRDRLRVIRIGVAMCLEEFCSVRRRIVGESIEAAESVNLGVRDLRHLRLVNVERAEPRRQREVAAQLMEGRNQRLSRRQRFCRKHLFAIKAESLCKPEPEFRMVLGAPLLVDEVFEQYLPCFE